MLRICCFWAVVLLFSCRTTTFYISRHAEKQGAVMATDPPLSAEGEKQALALRDYLKGKNIQTIYSTNYIRTKATAGPLSQHIGVPLSLYHPASLKNWVDSLKQATTGNVLIVGHSNTVDDLVNGFMGSSVMSDLADHEYGDLFIIRKKGNRYRFERIKVPPATQR